MGVLYNPCLYGNKLSLLWDSGLSGEFDNNEKVWSVKGAIGDLGSCNMLELRS